MAKKNRNKSVLNIEARLTELANMENHTDATYTEMYNLLNKLAHIYIHQNKFLYNYNGVDEVCHDVASDLMLKVLDKRVEVHAWMYYIGSMIKLSYIPAQKKLEHQVIEAQDNPVLVQTIREMSSGAYTSFINDFDLMQRSLLINSVGGIIYDTMQQNKFKRGTKEYNSIYLNVCLNLVRELDNENPTYVRIDQNIKPFVNSTIAQFKKNFRNAGFADTIYNSASTDAEWKLSQSDLYEDEKE